MKEYKSTCCSAQVKIATSELSNFLWGKQDDMTKPIITTCWFICTKCNNCCDVSVLDEKEGDK